MIDLSKLQNVKKVHNGHIARCPACASEGHDRDKSNLFVGEKGFYCHRCPRDKEHNKLIWRLCGKNTSRSQKSFNVRFKKNAAKEANDALDQNESRSLQTAQTVISDIHAAVEQHLLINKEILNKESEIHIKPEVIETPSVASVEIENSSLSAKVSHISPTCTPSDRDRMLTPPQNYLSHEMIEQGFRSITNWDELVEFAPAFAQEIEPIKTMFDATLREAVVKRETS